MSWNDGYFTDIDYVHRYQYVISPINIQMCLLLNGYVWPSNSTYRYLELGFGQGVSLNVHATISEGHFCGVDFHPDFAVSATEIAATTGVDINIYNESFKEFVQRKELPEFDIIVMHGVWTWISQDNQKLLTDFVQRKLAIGGVFYVSYNTPLGKWARALPLRNLMKIYYDRATTQADSPESRVKQAIDFMSRAALLNTNFLQNNQFINQEIEFIKNTSASYVAGEYLGDHWNLTSFSDMASILADTKLTFAAHASLVRNLDVLCLNEASKNKLLEVSDPILNEQLRDVLSNNEFRCDLWVKGLKQINPLERNKRLSEVRFVLSKLPSECDLTVQVSAGKIDLPPTLYMPILECLSQHNFKPKTAKELSTYEVLKGVDQKNIIDALLVLAAVHYIFVAQSDEQIKNTKIKTDRLNQLMLERAVQDDSMPYVISPVRGCALQLTRIQQLFLLARHEGAVTPDEWATLAWQLLSQQDSVVIIDNQQFSSLSEEGLNVLKTMARNFAQNKLPFLQILGIVD